MKTIVKKIISIASAFTMSVCCLSFNTSFAETTEDGYYTLSYDLDGGTCEVELEATTLKGGSATFVPEYELEKEGYYFSGWTYNNYLMYEPEDSFVMPNEDTTLVPVWIDAEDDNFRTITYDNEGCEVYGELKLTYSIAGRPFEITKDICIKEGFEQLGWTDGEHVFQKGEKMITPDHDVVLSPMWYEIHNIYYDAGDVDNVVGSTSVSFEKRTDVSFELADTSRLSRKGYEIGGWLCDVDGVVYSPETTYTMPDSDVHFTAVWKPLKYAVKFSASTKEYTTVDGVYGEPLIIPECEFTKSGYTFGGWIYDNVTYQPGDVFEIPALVKGKSIVFGCNWVKDSAVTTTTTETTTTTTTTTTVENPPIEIIYSVSDAVTLAHYLMLETEIPESSTFSYDVNNDGYINVFDLIMMKKQLQS